MSSSGLAVAWQTEHSVETLANQDFAWAYMTDVANWKDHPAEFRFEGPFVTGGRGRTEIPGQPARDWLLQNVQPIESYTIESDLEGAVLWFTWQFAGLPEGGTRLTQQITLQGENASSYVEDMQRAFAPNLGPGMKRIANAMDHAYAAGRGEPSSI
jgi:hypothetical protein